MASPIVVHQYAPAFGAPSGSPFCVKLTTWLNMADIDYTSEVLWDPRRAPQGKLPYITDGTTTVADSDVVIAHLREERGIALDEHLTPAQAAHAHALKRMIEESLYFVLVRLRWMTDDGWPLVKAAYFGAIPAPLRWIVPGVARRQVRRDLHGQGYGRHALSAVDAMGVADVDAIAAALGEAPEPSRERVQTCATRTTLYVSEGFLLDQKMTKMAPFAPGEGVASYPAQQNM